MSDSAQLQDVCSKNGRMLASCRKERQSEPSACAHGHMSTVTFSPIRRGANTSKDNLHLAESDPVSCFPTMPPCCGLDERPAGPGFKRTPTGSPLDPLFAPLALVNTIIAVPCWCGPCVNTVPVKGHHAPSKDDGSLNWALSIAAIFHLTGPPHTHTLTRKGTGSP